MSAINVKMVIRDVRLGKSWRILCPICNRFLGELTLFDEMINNQKLQLKKTVKLKCSKCSNEYII